MNKKETYLLRTIFTTDINECDRGTHSCHQFASCTNTVGNLTCSCLDGFAGDGLTCNGKNKQPQGITSKPLLIVFLLLPRC